jgi:hypothetical protein
MVNKALVLENRRGIMDRKKKQECRGQSGNNSRLRVGIPFTGPIQRTPQQQPRTRLQQRPQVTMQGYQTPQCQFIQHPTSLRPLLQEARFCKDNRPSRGQCRTLEMEGATIVVREDTLQVLVPSRETVPTRHLPPMPLLTEMVTRLLWQPGRILFAVGSIM